MFGPTLKHSPSLTLWGHQKRDAPALAFQRCPCPLSIQSIDDTSAIRVCASTTVQTHAHTHAHIPFSGLWSGFDMLPIILPNQPLEVLKREDEKGRACCQPRNAILHRGALSPRQQQRLVSERSSRSHSVVSLLRFMGYICIRQASAGKNEGVRRLC